MNSKCKVMACVPLSCWKDQNWDHVRRRGLYLFASAAVPIWIGQRQRFKASLRLFTKHIQGQAPYVIWPSFCLTTVSVVKVKFKFLCCMKDLWFLITSRLETNRARTKSPKSCSFCPGTTVLHLTPD